jgi:CelD/BcsL family acetyltransferase involved in cellulose biosynthesis
MGARGCLMKTTIYRDMSGFDTLGGEWDNLLERADNAPFFMKYIYQRTWWQYLGNDDLILIAFRNNDDQLVGLAPLYGKINPAGQRELSFVGCVDVSDYLDLIIDRDYVAEVHQALFDCLAGTDNLVWDKAYLCSLPHNSATHSQFAEAVRTLGWSAEVTQQDVCPVITLAASWDDYLAGIKKKQRHEIRRKIRKIEAETEVKWFVIDSTDGLAEAMDAFIDLHQKSTRDKQDFWDEDMMAFFKAVTLELAKGGWVRLYFIEVNGAKAATLLCFDTHHQILVYNSGYDPEQFANLSPGNVLVSYSIQDAIRLGRTRYDFLRGDEVYKFRFGAEAEPVYDLHITK